MSTFHKEKILNFLGFIPNNKYFLRYFYTIVFIISSILLLLSMVYIFFDFEWLNSFFDQYNHYLKTDITKQNALTNLVTPSLIFLLISIITIFLLKYMDKFDVRLENLKDLESNLRTIQKNSHEKEIDFKKQIFLNIPNLTFQFANKIDIENFYNDYFIKSTVEGIVSEKYGELSSGVKGTVPSILDSHIEGKNTNKITKSIKPYEISTAKKFLDYQNSIICENKVTLGIELVDINLSDLEKFNSIIDKLKKDFNFEIEENKLFEIRKDLKHKASEQTIDRLEKVSDWVLIDGRFKITEQESFYKLIYNHPVNDFISERDKHITISVLIDKEDIEANYKGNYNQSIGEFIPVKIYGQVWKQVSRKDNNWELQITPLAIY